MAIEIERDFLLKMVFWIGKKLAFNSESSKNQILNKYFQRM